MSGAKSRSLDLASLPINVWFVGQMGSMRQHGNRYTSESLRAHPGKMLPDLAGRLIEAYSRPGDWILDPLSGIGTTGVEAVHRDRNYVGIELEGHFLKHQQANLVKAQTAKPRIRVHLEPGDARSLADPNWRKSLPAFDAIITSPPYGDRLGVCQHTRETRQQMVQVESFGSDVLPGIYGVHPRNLGNLSGTRALSALQTVFEGCYAALKPGGVMAVVLQPERRQSRLLPFHHEAARLCTDLGFVLIDEIAAVIARVVAPDHGSADCLAHASLWRRLAVAHLRDAGFPVTLGQIEYVLVFQKPGAGQYSRVSAPKNKSGLSTALAGPEVSQGLERP